MNLFEGLHFEIIYNYNDKDNFFKKIKDRIIVEKRIKLTDDYVVHCAYLGTTVLVPKGFISDGASIPYGIRKFIKPYGCMLPAAILHDYIYSNQCLYVYDIEGETIKLPLSKKEADLIFLKQNELASKPPVSWWLRKVAYHAVKIFGKGAF